MKYLQRIVKLKTETKGTETLAMRYGLRGNHERIKESFQGFLELSLPSVSCPKELWTPHYSQNERIRAIGNGEKRGIEKPNVSRVNTERKKGS